MRSRRVRDLNIRLLSQTADGAESFNDFASVTEAREAVDAAMVDWVIFEIDHPHYPAVGRVFDSIDE